MPEIIRVGMGEYAIACAPAQLSALGLGSCVCVCFYDASLKIGALVHVMLPDSKGNRDKTHLTKFANTAIPYILNELELKGCARERLVVKISGGARMFQFTSSSSQISIGDRNVSAVEKALLAVGLVPAARETGGNYGRSVTLELETGELKLRTLHVELLKI